MPKKLDLTNQRFGRLIAIKEGPRNNAGRTTWICKCECGNEKSIPQTSLLNGIISCGCSRISKGEFKIANLLKEYNIPFTTEQTFESCINPKTHRKLRFDFFVNGSYLIEYNGKQHYDEKDGWDEPLEDIQYRDNIKINWAKNHNIPLIIIPYTKYDTLTINDLLLE